MAYIAKTWCDEGERERERGRASHGISLIRSDFSFSLNARAQQKTASLSRMSVELKTQPLGSTCLKVNAFPEKQCSIEV